MDKKKLIWIAVPAAVIIIVITILLVVFTGSKTNIENTGNENTNNENANNVTTPTLEYAENYKYWGMKGIETPSIPELTWEQKKVAQGVNVNIATTPFEVDIDKVYEELAQNKYLSENYAGLVTAKKEKGKGNYYNDAGYQIAYDVEDEISANLKDSKSTLSLKYTNDFSVRYCQDTSSYANYNYIQIYFAELEANDTLQEDLYSVVKTVFGDYAETLVFAKDPDGTDYNGKRIDGYSEIGFSELVEYESCSYYISREIDRSLTDNKISARFQIGVNYNSKEDVFGFEYYGLDHKSIYSELKYNFEDLLPTQMGNRNPLKFANFANSYYSSAFNDYARTILDSWNFEIYQNEDNEKFYYINLKVRGAGSGQSTIFSPSFDYQISISEKDDAITAIELKIEGSTSHETDDYEATEKNYPQLINVTKKLLSKVLPNENLSSISYKKDVKKYNKDISMKLLGEQLKGTLEVSVRNPAQVYSGGYIIKLKTEN